MLPSFSFYRNYIILHSIINITYCCLFVVTVFLVQWLAMKLHTKESQVQFSLIHKSIYAIFFFNAVFNVSSFTLIVLNEYCVVLYCTLQYCSVPYWNGLFCTEEYCLYCIVVYCTSKSYTVLYITIL